MTQPNPPVRPPSGLAPNVNNIYAYDDGGHARLNRWLATIALILGILLMGGTLAGAGVLAGGIIHSIRSSTTDTPTVGPEPNPDATTGCPFGPGQCGG
jgi:hypothetical protein